MSASFEWLQAETVYREVRPSKHGDELRWLVNRETIRNTQTGELVTRACLRHPGICVIVPQLDDDRILLMRQFRYAVNTALWELPAGTLSGRETQGRMLATETPEECAARELLEETGYQAAQFELLADCYAVPGLSDELMHIFLARELQQREQALDVGEVIYEVRGFSGAEITAMIGNGDIRDAKTLVGLFLALSRRPGGGQIASR